MKVPMIRPISWLGLLVSLIPLALFLAVNFLASPVTFPLAGAILYWLYAWTMRRLLTGAHRRGITLMKKGRFAEAIPFFEKAYAASKARPWIDRFRWLLLASASKMTYREMALCNLAFAYGQIGDGERMRTFYETALTEFPGSMLASTALRMLSAVQPKTG